MNAVTMFCISHCREPVRIGSALVDHPTLDITTTTTMADSVTSGTDKHQQQQQQVELGAVGSRVAGRLAASKDSGIMVDSSHNLNELTSSSQVCTLLSVYLQLSLKSRNLHKWAGL